MACEEYAVEAYEDYFSAFVALEEGYQRRIVRLLDHVKYSPTDVSFGGLKALQGVWRSYYQYLVSETHATRLIYWIDDELCTVNVDYLGNHPSWSHSRDRQNL